MTKHRIFMIAAIWILLVSIFPPINLLFPFGYAIKYAIFMAIALVLFPNLLTKGSMIALILFTVEAFIYYLFGNSLYERINEVITPFFAMGAALLLFEYSIQYDTDLKFTKNILLVSIIGLITICVFSIPILRINPEIIRLAYSMKYQDDQDVIAWSSWIIKWDTINGIVFLVAPLFFLCKRSFKKNKKIFVFWTLTLLLFYYITLHSNITMPLLMFSAMLVFAFLFPYERLNQNAIVKMLLVAILMALLLSPTVMVPAIDFVQEKVGYGSTYKRLEEIEYTIVHDESAGGDMENRNNLYQRSFDLFLEAPFTGTTTPDLISRHSYLLDKLACHGLFLIIPFILIFYFNFKKTYGVLKYTRVMYLLSVLLMFFMSVLKGESDFNFIFAFFLLPILCRYIDYSIENNFNGKLIRNGNK